MASWTQADVDAVNKRRGATLPAHLPPVAKRQKHGNIKTLVDGILFDSKRESIHYLHLKMRERLGEIQHLELQPKLELFIVRDVPPKAERIHIGFFTPDFRYWEKDSGSPTGCTLRIEDVKSKSSKTEAYELRKKIAEAIHGITITEVL